MGPAPTITTSSPRRMGVISLPLTTQARGSQKDASSYET